jgi:hypothetical protein
MSTTCILQHAVVCWVTTKNLDKGNDLPIVLNSSASSLCDLAARMKINIDHDIEKRMKTIDIINKLEDARYSIYV